MITAGIDAGSRTIKAVIWDSTEHRCLASGIADQGIQQDRLALDLFQRLLDQSALARDHVAAVVATGYGRHRVPFVDTTITEITCHARGVHHLMPETRTIIEIGGQDSKVIWLDAGGRVRDFSMNDRCAAGTGRFLELVASRLGLELSALDDLCRQSLQPALISNTCVVFAETEIIGLLAEAKALPDIVAGVLQAIALRVAALAGGAISSPLVFTGGVALQPGVTRALESALNCSIQVCQQPQFTGALGAALLAQGT
jgi:(R)-2-hydroxyacyl-CoA dehydratese activating ATPase